MKRRSLSTYVYALVFVAITAAVALWARAILTHAHHAAVTPQQTLIPDQWMATDFNGDGNIDWVTFARRGSGTIVRAYAGTARSPSWKVTIPGNFSGPARRVIIAGGRLLVPVKTTTRPAIDAVRSSDGKLVYSRALEGSRWSSAALLSAPSALVAVTGDHAHVRVTAIAAATGSIRWQRSFAGDLDDVRAPVMLVAGTVMVPMNGWVELLRADRNQLRPVTRGFELTGRGPQLLARPHTAKESATLLRWHARTLRFEPEQPAIALGSGLLAVAVYRDRVVSLLGKEATRVRVQPLDGGAPREATLPESTQVVGTPLLSPLAGWRRGDCAGDRYLPVVVERLHPDRHTPVRIVTLDTESATLVWSSRSLHIPSPVRFADSAFCRGGRYYWRIPSDAEKGGGLVIVDAATGKAEWLRLHTRSGTVVRPFRQLDPAHIAGDTLLGVSLLGRFAIDLGKRALAFDASNQLELTVTTP